jgi:hypothetical protein
VESRRRVFTLEHRREAAHLVISPTAKTTFDAPQNHRQDEPERKPQMGNGMDQCCQSAQLHCPAQTYVPSLDNANLGDLAVEKTCVPSVARLTFVATRGQWKTRLRRCSKADG